MCPFVQQAVDSFRPTVAYGCRAASGTSSPQTPHLSNWMADFIAQKIQVANRRPPNLAVDL